MKLGWICPGLLAAAFSVPAYPQIYKCGAEDSISYQEKPCVTGPTTIIVPAPRAVPNPDARNASSSAANERPAVAVRVRETVNVGMTDLQVLNLRGWGRPQNIARNKANRVWYEEWTYNSPTQGLRLLRFANGTLTAIESDLPAAGSVEVVNLQ